MSDSLMTRDQVAAVLGVAPEAVRSTVRRAGIIEERGYSRERVLALARERDAKRRNHA